MYTFKIWDKLVAFYSGDATTEDAGGSSWGGGVGDSGGGAVWGGGGGGDSGGREWGSGAGATSDAGGAASGGAGLGAATNQMNTADMEYEKVELSMAPLDVLVRALRGVQGDHVTGERVDEVMELVEAEAANLENRDCERFLQACVTPIFSSIPKEPSKLKGTVLCMDLVAKMLKALSLQVEEEAAKEDEAPVEDENQELKEEGDEGQEEEADAAPEEEAETTEVDAEAEEDEEELAGKKEGITLGISNGNDTLEQEIQEEEKDAGISDGNENDPDRADAVEEDTNYEHEEDEDEGNDNEDPMEEEEQDKTEESTENVSDGEPSTNDSNVMSLEAEAEGEADDSNDPVEEKKQHETEEMSENGNIEDPSTGDESNKRPLEEAPDEEPSSKVKRVDKSGGNPSADPKLFMFDAFVTGLSRDVTEAEVEALFGSVGEVEVKLPKFKDSETIKGIAHVNFLSEEAREKAIDKFSGYEWKGSQMKIDKSPARNMLFVRHLSSSWKPSEVEYWMKQKYTQLSRVDVPSEPFEEVHRGFCYLVFNTPFDAHLAFYTYKQEGLEIQGVSLTMSWAVRKAIKDSPKEMDLSTTKSILVSGVDDNTDYGTIFKVFSQFGPIETAMLRKKKKRTKGKATAFVNFKHRDDALKAVEEMDNTFHKDFPYKVRVCLSRPPDQLIGRRPKVSMEDVSDQMLAEGLKVCVRGGNRAGDVEEQFTLSYHHSDRFF
eukprot:CAMPEP_0117742368 /NCGR_PEP_ID=MMETSP0947-20121206/5508_1 /TAXON_ID=44440 /ORGANISM="Chattonella subsalsa, Strain CCMP2191" /LENGTH=718 /DNA_ID=CAMNT_0005558885 /DNA_START=123 /DNA_END=2279 /DNA_ORIENTATION=-